MGERERLQELSRLISEARREGRDYADLVAEHQALCKLVPKGQKPNKRQPPEPPALRVIDDMTELRCLLPQYHQLLADSGALSPFLTLDWLDPWFEAFGGGYDLNVAVVEQGDKLLAAAPLMLGEEKRRGLRRKVARFVGTGPGLRGNYFTFPVSNEALPAALPLLDEHLQSLLEQQYSLDFEHLSPFADRVPTVEVLCARPRRELALKTEHACVHGPLPGSFEDFVATVPAATRRTSLRRGDEELRAEGEVRYELCERPEHVPEFLGLLGRFNIERRSREDQVSTWGDERNMACRETVATRFLERGGLRLELLLHQDRPLAALMGLVHGETYFCYNMGLDQEYAKFQPGHLLIAHRLKGCIDEGLTAWNFLVGDADYKRQYFRQSLPELHVTLAPSDARRRCVDSACNLARDMFILVRQTFLRPTRP